MNCKAFELVMAEALGDELDPADRPALEEHLASCERCRREFAALRATVETLQGLTAPQCVETQRIGDRLVIGSPTGAAPSHGARRWSGLWRYAACVLIAFTAGYALHAGMTVYEMSRGGDSITPRPQAAPTIVRAHDDGSVEATLVSTHQRDPSRSNLAKCMIAMFQTKR